MADRDVALTSATLDKQLLRMVHASIVLLCKQRLVAGACRLLVMRNLKFARTEAANYAQPTRGPGQMGSHVDQMSAAPGSSFCLMEHVKIVGNMPERRAMAGSADQIFAM